MNRVTAEPIKDAYFETSETFQTWLQAQKESYGLTYLLAHADDGVIWGHFRQGALMTSHEVLSQSPKLSPHTLQQCRLFGEAGELLIWKTRKGWHSRFIGNPDLETKPIEEKQLLWGTHRVEDETAGFTVLRDGVQGLKHAVPLIGINRNNNDELTSPVRLIVRHYITYDRDGLAQIQLSRLVTLIANTH
ncbi:MAG: CRISPR-associated protein Csx19 [Cyanobacteria bacterium P01_F01_bin.150]